MRLVGDVAQPTLKSSIPVFVENRKLSRGNVAEGLGTELQNSCKQTVIEGGGDKTTMRRAIQGGKNKQELCPKPVIAGALTREQLPKE